MENRNGCLYEISILVGTVLGFLLGIAPAGIYLTMRCYGFEPTQAILQREETGNRLEIITQNGTRYQLYKNREEYKDKEEYSLIEP